MAIQCHVCGKDEGTLYPDPCCSAPDCERLNDVVHFECASDFVKNEIRDLESKDGCVY